MSVRLAEAGDAAAIAAIYAPFVTGTAVSFEVDAPDEAEMRARIASGAGLYPWLVDCGEAGEVVGFASAGAFRTRRAYRFSVETSVYVSPSAQRRGIGAALYTRLLALLEAQGFTQAIAAITLPNDSSVALHERFAFTQAGTYRDVGYKFGEWRSVGLWQRPLAPLTTAPEEAKMVAEVWRD
jgi:L-amino acid N-acyltransferase YncA